MSESVTSLSQLERDLRLVMGSDRFRLRRRLRNIQDAKRAKKPFDRNLSRLQKEVARSLKQRQDRAGAVPKIEYDPELPITASRDEIAQAIKNHQVIVVCGETGSGKSTQLPKICLDIGRGIDGMIGHTQPRRIAARSVSARIAEELNSPLGENVGYKIRFTDTTKPSTYIKLMTDGILLAETQHDRFLNAYDTIIIDEAHERSLNIDFLLGYIKRLLPKRRDLRLIITSATIDAKRFSEHFETAAGPAPVLEVSGRTYPVETRYRPMISEEDDGSEPDPMQCLKAAVDELARENPVGDLLIFLPTERDIREAAQTLRGHKIPGDSPGRMTEILPLYGRLSTKEQNRVFQTSKWRRIVMATNVAESSLTVPGIRYVIDTGTARISRYSARSQVQRLPIEPISQASANQRKGRCGRIGPGICIRLYSQDDFESRDEFTPPEIQRTNLASVILQTTALNLGNLEDFPFLDPPKSTTIRDGYKTLFELGAMDEKEQLTEIGRQLSRLPVDPRIGRMVLAGETESCLHEVLIIASALELQDPRERPIEKQQAADAAHEKFRHEESDFLSYLKLWEFYHKLRGDVSRSRLRKACQQHFLSYNRLREWSDIYHQLLQLVEDAGFKTHKKTPKASVGRKPQDSSHPDHSKEEYALLTEPIHRALLTGLLSNIAFRAETYEYTGAGGTKFHLWPGSGIFEKKPKWVLAAELVETSRRYLRTVAKLNPNWIEPLAGHLIKKTHSEPHWSAETGSVMAFEKVSLFGLVIVPRRKVRYGSIDTAKSRELFLWHGLVEGDIEETMARRIDFFEHNQKLLEEVNAMEAKSRNRDLLMGEESRFDFYDRRIPAEVCDVRSLEKWWKEIKRTEPRLLLMSKSDLLQAGSEDLTDEDFPNALTIDRMQLPLEYHLNPGSDYDGITLVVPQAGVNQLDPRRLGWLVPGLLEEKIVALIKSLPKDLRRSFVPAPDTAKEVLRVLRFGQGDMTAEVAGILSRLAGEPIPATAFDQTRLPSHLRMNVKIVDEAGEKIAAGRDLGELRGQLGSKASASFAEMDDHTWNRPDLTEWNFGDLPAEVELNRGGVLLKGYPTLVDHGESVSLQLADTPQKAAALIRPGVRRLFILKFRKHLKTQVDYLPSLNQLLLPAATLPGGIDGFREQLSKRIAERAVFLDDKIPRTQKAFEKLLSAGKNRISTGVQDVIKLAQPLMEHYHAIQVPLEGKCAAAYQSAYDDLYEQLFYLMEENFFADAPWAWLWQYPRYLRAMKFRLDKLSEGGVTRDRENQAIIAPFWKRYLERAESHREREIYDPHLTHYRYMVEEFRVSLFAQKLGTGITVSEKRLAEQWKNVGT